MRMSIVVGVLLGLCLVLPVNSIDLTSSVENSGRFRVSTAHEPVIIASDGALQSSGFPGDGSMEKPYIIDGLEISSTWGPCIAIWNVSLYYVISDCLLTGVPGSTTYGAIDINEAGLGVIRDCEITDNNVGIRLQNNDEAVNVIGCSFSDNPYTSLWVINCSVVIDGCSFMVTEWEPAVLIQGDGTYIKNSVFDMDSGNCIKAINSDSLFIDSCAFNGGSTSHGAFDMQGVSGFNIQDSSFRNAGIEVGTTENVSDLTVAGCNISGDVGIRAGQHMNGTVIIHGNDVSMASIGVLIEMPSHAEVTENVITQSTVGISVTANSAFIGNNTVEQNILGISISGDNNTIYGNLIRNNTKGIEILTDGETNRIYYNWFMMNTHDAYDYGTGNVFDDGVSLGNYWDTPSENGVHQILGSSGSVDRYPVYIPPPSNDVTLMVVVTLLSVAAVIVVSAYMIKRRA